MGGVCVGGLVWHQRRRPSVTKGLSNASVPQRRGGNGGVMWEDVREGMGGTRWRGGVEGRWREGGGVTLSPVTPQTRAKCSNGGGGGG